MGICSSNPLISILTHHSLNLFLSLLQLDQMLVFQQNASYDYFCENGCTQFLDDNWAIIDTFVDDSRILH